MNRRERFIKTMTFDFPDRPASGDYFYYESTRKRWENEGLPVDADFNKFFNMDFDPFQWCIPVNVAGPVPDFGITTLEENEEFLIRQNPNGEIVKILKDQPPPAMPQWVRYPLESRKDWDEFKKRLNPDSEQRIGNTFLELLKNEHNRDYPLGMWVGGTYGHLRNWWGVENISTLFYDDPALIEEMLEYLTNLSLKMLDRVLSTGIKLDWVMFWEDMAYKTGPLISPKMFKQYCSPYYKKIMEKVNAANIPIAMVDSDGNIDELIPLWLDAGINIMHPLEVAAGMDVIKLRETYGKKIGFFGGIDKRILATSKEIIRSEISPILEKCFEDGGFIPSCDHAIPPDVSFDNYRFYRDLVCEMSGKVAK
ncbi:MAG: hypothetical protein A2Y12_17255 [Planctomycetes bacterium GWF2_42_9]|nr:MAG: hypothetical protein A2Y12_17255 [Planctomycetes bacterium GWF2_42_9]